MAVIVAWEIFHVWRNCDLSLDIMVSFSRPRYSPIGLHCGPRWLSLIQLSGLPETAEIVALAQRPWPERSGLSDKQFDEVVASSIKLLVADHGFRGREVVSCVPAEELFLQSVRLPQLPPEEMAKVVRLEAQERLPYPVQEAELRHLLAGQIRQDMTVKQEVVLMACPQTALTRHLQIIEDAGLAPGAIDVEPCAVLRAFRHGRAEPDERVAYLHLGDHIATVLIADGDSILFLKYVGAGGKELDQAVAKHLELELPEANRLRSSVTNSASLDSESDVHRSIIEAIRPRLESLASEVELCFRYFMVTFRGQPLSKLIVTGSEASSWLADYLGQSLACQVEVGNPLSHLVAPNSPNSIEHPGRWAAALGLALRTSE